MSSVMRVLSLSLCLQRNQSHHNAMRNAANYKHNLFYNSNFKYCSIEKNHDCWGFTSSYSSSESSTKSLLGMVSNKGSFKLYDTRNVQVPSVNVDLGIKTLNNSVQLRLKPSYDCSISVSGFDGNVYVYQLVSEPELVFTHDGHRHVEGFDSQTTTTNHLWYPYMDNLVISTASNGTIQAWQFEDQRKCNKT